MFKLKLDGFPFVLVDRHIQGLKVDIVESDHESGARMATEHLLAHGHHRIHMLSCKPGALSSADARWRGYEQALLDRGIEPVREWRVVCEDDSPDGDRPAWQKWQDTVLPVLEELARPAAFVTLNAYAGRGLLEACRKLGLRVPEDVSVVSFDDTEFMQAFSPPVTVIAQRTRLIGRAAVEQLERRLQGGAELEPQQTRIDMDLIERQSVLRLTDTI
jgi:LacI family transcriptional regulator